MSAFSQILEKDEDQRLARLEKLKVIIEEHQMKQQAFMVFNAEPAQEDGKAKKEEAADLIVPEEKLPGKIAFRDYLNLFSFGPGGFGFFIFFLVCLLTALA